MFKKIGKKLADAADDAMSPKASLTKKVPGLVLKSKKQVIPPQTMLANGTPDLPLPKGLKKGVPPVRSLTAKQDAKEMRSRGFAQNKGKKK